MTQEDDNQKKQEPGEQNANPADLHDLVGGLDLTPQWAKEGGSPSLDKLSRKYDRGDAPRGRGRGPRDRKPRPRHDSRGGDRPRKPRGDRGPREGRPQRGGPRHREQEPRLPVEIAFIPERDRLGAVVKLVHSLKKAFPLPYLASLFLTKPEYHLVKIEAQPQKDAEPLTFYQCKETRAVFLTQPELTDYLVRCHLEKHFERIEIDAEPPTGNFVCVGRCRKSGMLLGPPNYHGFNERVAEVHRSRFSHMRLDEYRNNIEMVREPEVIEEWKASCTKKALYRPVDDKEAEPTMTLAQAERLFIDRFADSYMQSGHRVIVPATMIREISNRALLNTIRAARVREDRLPFSLMLALRPAFKRMRLHLVKAGKNETYVMSAAPKPIDAEHAIPAIKKTVEIITAHPGCRRKQLLTELFPGKTLQDEEVTQELESLVWLIDKGHIIEFFNGTLAIPGHLRDPGVVPREMPQAHHHEEKKRAAAKPSVSEKKDQDEKPADPEPAAAAEPAPVETPPEPEVESGEPAMENQGSEDATAPVESEKAPEINDVLDDEQTRAVQNGN